MSLTETGHRLLADARAMLALADEADQRLHEDQTVLISEGVTSLREAARAGLGIAVLPDWLIREDILSGRLVRILPLWKAKELPCHVVYQGHRMLPVRVRTFVDFAVTHMTTELRFKV